RGSLQADELRVAFGANKVEVYERLTALCLRRGLKDSPAEEAFGYIQRAKSRCLADCMFGRAHPLATPSGESVAGAEASQLRKQLNWYYHRIESEEIRREGVSAARIEHLWEQARACEDELLRAVRKMRVQGDGRSAEYDSPVTLDEVQATLDASSVLIEYFQTGDQIIAAVLTRQSIEIVPLAQASSVRRGLRMLQLQLSKFHFGP